MACASAETNIMNERGGESENSSLDEWTLIGDKESHDNIRVENHDGNSVNEDNGDSSAAEEAREAIQILGQSSTIDDTKDDENRIESFVARDDDSDGISVITDIDKGDDTLCGNVSKLIYPNEKIPPVRTFVHIIVACSLAVAIGFGIGYFVGTGKTQLSSNDVNFGHSQNVKSFDHVDELQPKTVLTVDDIDDENPVNDENPINFIETLWKRSINVENTNNNLDSFDDIMEKVQLSLDTLCSIVENESNSFSGCNSHSTILELIRLKDNVNSIIKNTVFAEENSNDRFIQNMESRLTDISLAFFDDLSQAIKSSIAKIDRKFNKVRRKLNKRLCLIRNTMGNDPKFVTLLKMQNITDEYCLMENPKELNEQESKKFDWTKKMVNFEVKHETFPVGPEVKSQMNLSRLKKEAKDYLNKGNAANEDSGEFVKGKKKYRPRTDFSKGDFTPQRQSLGIDASKEKYQIHRPEIPKKKFNKSESVEEVCHAKSCPKQRNNDRKNVRGTTKEDWQFKRSEGRKNWRNENENIETSWDYNRARGRESARKNF